MWNPKQYAKFNDHRNRPALELMNRIPHEMKFNTMIDLGCGSGELTQTLKDKFNIQTVHGIDNSESMLESAKSNFNDITFKIGDIANFNESTDLIFSNAAIQWVNNHSTLFPNLLKLSNKLLAVQMPRNFNAPDHVLMRETAQENKKFKDKLHGVLHEEPVFGCQTYYKLLYNNCTKLDIWETTYTQELTGANAVLEWMKGTGLVPIANNLTTDEYNEFLEIYNSKLLKAYPMLDNGVTLYPFKRIFIVATK